MRTGPQTSARTISLVAVSTSISVPDPSSPNRSFHALGRTIKDAPVSTNASHLRPLETSEALSILTEAMILPIIQSLNSNYKPRAQTQRTPRTSQRNAELRLLSAPLAENSATSAVNSDERWAILISV